MKKQKLAKILFHELTRLQALILLIVLIAASITMPLVRADRFDDQINALRQQNAAADQKRAQLRVEANDISGAIANLQSQINALEAQITENENKRASLEKQIADAEAELARQRKLLGENIKAMYIEGQITTLEMLASSNDLSEFVDKQQYRDAVRSKIKSTLDRITQLKHELKAQKETVEKLLVDQQNMQDSLAVQRAESNRLLGLNQSQQAEYNSQIKSNNAQISELRRQQVIANARFSVGSPGSGPACGGGYPGQASGPGGSWGCDYPLDYNIDNWGMYNRECVSYAAFKVAASGRHMPYWGGYGDANQWDNNARSQGIGVDGNPREGDIAQTDNGPYGHVMHVEYVYGDGTILISQYNANLDGRYSERRISAAGLNFIHF